MATNPGTIVVYAAASESDSTRMCSAEVNQAKADRRGRPQRDQAPRRHRPGVDRLEAIARQDPRQDRLEQVDGEVRRRTAARAAAERQEGMGVARRS